MLPDNLEFVGFWPRVLAMTIDTTLLFCVTFPILTAVYGESYWSSGELVAGPVDFFINWVMPIVVTIAFWYMKDATPGKMVIHARVVDARTLAPMSMGQGIGRYFAYLVSILPLCLGCIWVAFDKNHLAWHDKLCGTAVVRPKRVSVRTVQYK